MCPRRQKRKTVWTFLTKVLIGLSLGFCLLFCVSSIGIIWGGAQWALGEHPPSLRQVGRGREGWVCLTEACMLGLSDFASKGEQCDACVCEEGPSGRGSAEDLCSGTWAHLGGVFPLVLPYSARTCLEHRLRPLCQPFWGLCWPCEYAGVVPRGSLPVAPSGGMDCCLV